MGAALKQEEFNLLAEDANGVIPLASKDELNNKTLVILEDDPTTMKYLEKLTSKYFNKVFTFTCAETAKSFIESTKEPIDFLFADFYLPGKDGGSVAKQVKEKDPHTKVYIISGHLDKAMDDNLGKYVNDFIPKPICSDVILENIK